MSHKKGHTAMVRAVLNELARQQESTVESIMEQLFYRSRIVNTELLSDVFRQSFQRLYPSESFNHVIWCPFCQCFDLTQRGDTMLQGRAFWTFSSTQF